MTARTYRARLVTLEPVSLGLGSEVAFRRDIYRYIPGIVLRGALAALWIGQYGKPIGSNREQFRQLFEVGIRPGPLRPPDSYVRPLSVSRCKYPPDLHHSTRSIRDEAFTGQAGPRYRCDVDGCLAPVEYGRGELELAPDADPIMSVTHVAHTRDGTAKQGALHTRQYLRPGMEFTGSLVAPPEEFLEGFAEGCEVWLGGRRTVAGRATLTLTAEPAPEPPAIAAEVPFAIRLDAPAVLVDDVGRPVFDLGAAELASALGLAADECSIEARWWRPVTIGGWHMATGLSKPVDRGLAIGSTWVVTTRRAVSGDRLASLLRDGLGVRRAEGFGQVRVAREAWTSPDLLTPADQGIEPALAGARRLWPYVSDPGPREMLLNHLRELAGRPPGTWREISAQFWRRETGRRLARTGVDAVLQRLVNAGDASLVRDVRCVLDAAGVPGARPRWLNMSLAADQLQKVGSR